MAMVATGVFALVRIFVGERSGEWWKAALRLAGGVLIGLALAAPLLALFREYLPLSYNSHSNLSDRPPETDPLTVFLNWMMPRISPILSGDTRGNFSFTRNWVGAGAMVLAGRRFAGATRVEATQRGVAARRRRRGGHDPDLRRGTGRVDPLPAGVVASAVAGVRHADHRPRSRAPRRRRGAGARRPCRAVVAGAGVDRGGRRARVPRGARQRPQHRAHRRGVLPRRVAHRGARRRHHRRRRAAFHACGRGRRS